MWFKTTWMMPPSATGFMERADFSTLIERPCILNFCQTCFSVIRGNDA
jgi:hypothetical protein